MSNVSDCCTERQVGHQVSLLSPQVFLTVYIQYSVYIYSTVCIWPFLMVVGPPVCIPCPVERRPPWSDTEEQAQPVPWKTRTCSLSLCQTGRMAWLESYQSKVASETLTVKSTPHYCSQKICRIILANG